MDKNNGLNKLKRNIEKIEQEVIEKIDNVDISEFKLKEDFSARNKITSEIGSHFNRLCKCEHRITTRRVLQNGAITAWYQCGMCGSGSQGRKKDLTLDTPCYDPNLRRSALILMSEYHEKIRNYVELKVQLHTDMLKKKRRNIYLDHLNSDKWEKIRLKVLKRDNYVCQGCLENEASQVHHFTYNNLGNEFCFELTSLCFDCHNKLHEKEKQFRGIY